MQNTHCKCGCRQNTNRMASNCSCVQENTQDCTYIAVPTTGMVYTAMQEFKDLYDTCVGFGRGTIFAELDKPLLVGGRSCGK